MQEEIEKIIQRVQSGETQAYSYIVKQYQQQMLVYCWRLLGNKHEAEDAVQDIFVKGFEKIHLYRPSVSFSSWLYKVAYHHCMNILKRKKLQFKFKFRLFNQPTETESAADTVNRKLFSEPLSKALLKLSAEERNLLVLRIFEEKSFEEIGIILDRSPEAAKKKYARTRKHLIKILEAETEETLCVNYKTISQTKN